MGRLFGLPCGSGNGSGHKRGIHRLRKRGRLIYSARLPLATGGASAIELLKSVDYRVLIGERKVRTSLEIPAGLHRQLHEAAARQGCSARQLILSSIERAVADMPRRPARRLGVRSPIVSSRGKPFDLTNEQIYDLISLP